MKKIRFLLVVCFIVGTTTLKSQTKADSIAIEKACRDYVEGWAEGNAERVAKAVSPELVKRNISQDSEGASIITDMGASLLIGITKRNKGGVKAKDFEPNKPFKLDVFIYDISGDYALAKAVNAKYNFFDYCQLAKYNGEWKIINVLWGYLPPKN
ncbi:MAG TPA: hypothetical protein DIW31_07860 [Bacteroidales bacterium]|nr:hypothetical protein [Bacteroidales bacterium]